MSRAAKSLTDFNDYLAALKASDSREGVVAFFDLDRTLINGYSITSLALQKVFSGSLSAKRIFVHAGIFLHWGLGRSDYHQLLEATVSELVGMSALEFKELGEQAFEHRIKPIIYLEGRQLIDLHRALGHEVVIVTSATRYQVEPIARELGVEQIYCTELEVERGVITGNVTPCYGPGKMKAAEVHAGFREVDLMEAYFYTDSSEDLALLEEVGRPVVVNAKSSLAKIAGLRDWPMLEFEIQGRTVPAIAA